jgi:large conductance mechanosensitive channel
MGFFQEFKTFAVRGNVVDMAVGIIIGAAFGKIVSSLVADVFMPPIGLLLGGIDFTGFAFTLKEAAGPLPAVTLGYGKFIQSVVDFVIVACAVFVLVKSINRFRAKQEAAPAAPPKQEVLLAEIRDILKAGK